ncbi:hypothetical protein N7488_004038 [Penicillium malachiteum]|nr:hypothetical protein N7488_004038 [Penicillium malachiteum]
MKIFQVTQLVGEDAINAWHYDAPTALMDLARGSTSSAMTLQTTTHPIRVNTEKTALLIIDMQNFFLRPALRIPAARLHGIQVIWLNWGHTEQDLNTMTQAIIRTFGSFSMPAPESNASLPSKPGMVRVKNPVLYKDLGADLGAVRVGHAGNIQCGKIFMRESWNNEIYGPLEADYRRHCRICNSESDSDVSDRKRDMLIYKDRMSRLSGKDSDMENLLCSQGVITLLLAGVNTDQCVGGTLMDAYNEGFDCVLLRDGTATGSPFGAKEEWEWNAAGFLGSVSSFEALKLSSAIL